MVPMAYKQKELVNGTAVPVFLAGNPALLSQISQISGTASIGNQKYNALQATFHKRFSAGLEYQVAYTWSRGMSDAIGYYGQGGQAGSQSAYWQNVFNQRAEWEPDLFRRKTSHRRLVCLRTAFRKRKDVRQLVEQSRRWCRGWLAAGWYFHRAYRVPTDYQSLGRSLGHRCGVSAATWSAPERSACDRIRRALARSERIRRAGSRYVRKRRSRHCARAGDGSHDLTLGRSFTSRSRSISNFEVRRSTSLIRRFS